MQIERQREEEKTRERQRGVERDKAKEIQRGNLARRQIAQLQMD